ncbi:protein disulfide-isomerase A5-like [Mytilus californianus]|uniref:protein disulfide-isomerase A5-like n=1 Tax=Mytilus californianus TaxID=6549 RepID=UPI002245D391|nr:protein disulfide-isomerase A5-like [Mytilus californianus]
MARIYLLLLILLVNVSVKLGARQKVSLIQDIDDPKEFKKILRTKTNLLIIYAKSGKEYGKLKNVFEDVAEQMKGKATLGLVDCSDAKKLCKNQKVSPSTIEVKHYKDGSYNKDYDRKLVSKSLVNFLMDPTGDIPWEEEPTAGDVVHVETPEQFGKLLKQKKKILAMFYAPWCGFCKRMKPDFSAAATELKGKVALAGIDVDKPHQMPLRAEYNITGFPTLYYFENGKKKFLYGGENNKDSIIEWLNDPKPPAEKKKEAEWADEESDVVHLTDSTYDEYLQNNPSVLVMFYAPWCGHCKQMKPEYTETASKMKEQNIVGTLAAVDATQHKTVSDRYKIQGFPTVKYFKDGEFAFDLNERTGAKILEFMKDPKEPPPPPPPEAKWEEVESDVLHLNDENYKSILKKKKHALVMFYAPWCGHCKKAKPEFMAAAARFKDDGKVAFSAVDCTVHTSICSTNEVTGYPTLKYFNYGKNPQNYMGGREEADFVNFMNDPQNPGASPSQPPPEAPEEQWKEITGYRNIHFPTGSSFDSFIKQHNSVLVMFYAPWCGHCKAMKPAYAEAASLLKDQNVEGVLAAVDATIDSQIAGLYKVQGYPTIKYFKNGIESFEYSGGRKVTDLVSFMKNPQPAAPTPPPEPEWSSIKSAVKHLSDSDFKSQLSKYKASLVMFYAPWCGHCKSSKPIFQNAADSLKDKQKAFVAVDCTKSRETCNEEKIEGFPTFKLYVGNKFLSEYEGGRSEKDFLKFINNSPEATKEEL